ncbi:MAG: protein kinase [Myxococcales bacterium]|nr:protein kinase [Myxococcales bacterium]
MPHLDENDVLQYVAGLLDAPRAEQVEAHVADCDECRFLLAEAGAEQADEAPSLQATQLDLDEQRTDVARLPSRAAPRPGEHDPRIGQVLNDTYVIESLIGRGGMGAVYSARHRLLPKRYAIKLLGGATAAGSSANEAVERMRREAEVTSRLHHPGIVEVLDFNYALDGTPFIVMELLEGEPLSRRMRRGLLPPHEVASVAQQVADALGASHRAGIVHRDLKPTNIFLARGEDGTVSAKVMDFGISKVLGAQSGLTGDVSVLGSPRYMAPEQARGRSAEVDQRADIFAMGVIVFEMLAGAPPFVGDSVPDTLFKIVYEQPVTTARWQQVPAPIRWVVLRALDKDREKRPATMEALADSLRQAFDKSEPSFGDDEGLPPHEATALVDTPVPAALAPASVGARARRRLLAAAGGLTAAALGALVLVVALGSGGEGKAPAVDNDVGIKVAVVDSAVAPDVGGRVALAGTGTGTAAEPKAKRAAEPQAKRGTGVAVVRRHKRVRRRRYGSLTVQSKARVDGRYMWATVYLDGRRVGQTALTLEKVRAGRHRITVRRAGYRAKTRVVWVRDGQRTRVRFALRKR